MLATVRPFGPDAEGDATVTVLEAGQHFAWLRCREDGEKWSREIDVEVNRFGTVVLTHRIQIHLHERQRRYKLAKDRPAMRDYEEGRVKFGLSPDQAVYFQVLLRDYLEHRSEDSLFVSTPLIEKMKRLPTTLDPKVTAPARVAMGADKAAAISLTVHFKAPFPPRASAQVAGLPDGVAADPAAVEWAPKRGRTQSPPIRLRGTVAKETSVTVNWRIGKGWQGAARVTLAPNSSAAAVKQ